MNNLNVTSTIISKPFNESSEPIDLSLIGINFNRKNHYINSLFYQQIIISGSNIYADNININRRPLIRKIYVYVINQLLFGGIRESKISYNLSRLFQFIRWCDSKGIHNCLDNEISCIDAINSYVNYCWEEVALGKNKASTITDKLQTLINMLKEIVSEELHQCFPKVKTSLKDRELTLPPMTYTLVKTFKYYIQLLMVHMILLLIKRHIPMHGKYLNF